MVMGDTDRTPDGSGAFDFLGRGNPNVRKAAAYTYQALLDLAAKRLGVPKQQAFGERRNRLGRRQEHFLRRPGEGPAVEAHHPACKGDLTSIMGLTVDGNPPLKPVSEYTGHRQVFHELGYRLQSSGQRNGPSMCACPTGFTRGWGGSPSLGSTLGPLGLSTKRSSPMPRWSSKATWWEWFAYGMGSDLRAAQQVAGATKWKDWKGLPGHGRLFDYLKQRRRLEHRARHQEREMAAPSGRHGRGRQETSSPISFLI